MTIRDEMNNGFDKYREQVRSMRANRSSELIYNSSAAHAAVLIEELFNSSEKQVGILTSALDADVYGLPALINSAQAFLENPKAKLTIVTETKLTANHPFLAQTAGDPRYNNKVSIHMLTPELAPPFNFMVADAIAYRFEEDKASASAVACFSGRNVAQRMHSMMDFWSTLPADGWSGRVAA